MQKASDHPISKTGRSEGDLNIYWSNRSLANRHADEGYLKFKEYVVSTSVQFEPDWGFVAVLMTTQPLPEASQLGFEVHQYKAPATDPDEERGRRASRHNTAPKPTSGGRTPRASGKGGSSVAGEVLDKLHEESPLNKGDIGRALAALKVAGIGGKSAERKFVRWLKRKGLE